METSSYVMSSSHASPNMTSSSDSFVSATAPLTTPSSKNPDAKMPSTSTPSSSPKRTVVAAERKEELLLKARTERKRWVRTVPLPYDPRLLPGSHSRATTAASIEEYDDDDVDDDNTSQCSTAGIKRFQKLLVFDDRVSRKATAVLSELYGVDSSTLEGCSDETNERGDDSEDYGTDLPKSPLTIDEVSERFDRLSKPFFEDGENEAKGDSTGSTGDKMSEDPKPQSTDGGEAHTERDARNDTYKDVRAAYEEFMTVMLLPESAVTVQGMKNFAWQFPTVVAGLKKNGDDDDDRLLRNMAAAVNGHIRSSHESLATKKSSDNAISASNDAQAQGQPNMNRRSLESFLYGQVKTVIDTTLDRILGNSGAPTSPTSPFLMTQDSFDKRLEELQFLQPSHLELTCLKDDSEDTDTSMPQTNLEKLLEGPIKALQSMGSFYSPYEKLCRVLDVYHGLNAVLKKASKSLPMADDVISGMILVIVKASAATKANSKDSMKNLLRDLHFVENFATQEYKRVGQGEMEYAFTSLYGAVYFLQGVELNFQRDEINQGSKTSSNRLCISNEELRRGLEKSRLLAAKNNAKSNTATQGGEGAQPKGLISRRVDELLGEHDAVGADAGNLSSFAPNPYQLTVREVRAARLRGESLDFAWALRQQTKTHETGSVRADVPTSSTTTSSPSKSTSRSVFVPQKHSFLGVRPESIKLSDLPKLLDEYRNLVLANEQLLGEHQRANNRVQMERKRLREEKHRRTLGEQALLL